MGDPAVLNGTIVAESSGGTVADASSHGAPSGAATSAAGELRPGSMLGPRYEIVRLLGKGGMGAVYLARDRELKRDVALKVIAPHLAAEPDTLERFRREIHLSSIVTHPNVLRVYDLGESGGVRFLTMQYIEGRSLAELLEAERPLTVERAVELFRQICDGLAAAHAQGVLHRDLKPQNVMIDADAHAYLTDFGLATSESLSTMTRAGALMGTPQYMSPEQVKGLPVDVRSDVFSLGVMFYEMLSGAQPYSGDTIFEVMIRRTQAPPRPLAETNGKVPVALQRLVDRCLAIEPDLRYASVAEIVADLDAGTVRVPVLRRIIRPRLWPRRVRVAFGLGLVLLVGATVAIVGGRLTPKPAQAPTPRTVLVADFDNRTGESVFNGTFEPALITALEGASFITTYNRGAAQRVAAQLKLDGDGLGEKRARLVAQREGVGIVTTGFIDKEGTGYRIGVRAVDAFTGQRIFEAAEEASGRDAALATVTKLAAGVRKKLGDVTPESVQQKEGETFGAASLEAAHEYAIGMDLQWKGDYEEARKRHLEALKLDPDMGRAYTALAVMEANRSRHAEAEKYFASALSRTARMTDREKFRTRGSYYLFSRQADKAIEAYTALVRQYPADTAGYANLALGYVWAADFKRALEEVRKFLALYPNNVPQRNNIGLFAMYVGDFATAIEEQRKTIDLNPRFVNAYIGMALAQLAAGQRDQALETWRTLEAFGGDAVSPAKEGLADLALFEGRLADARQLLETGIAADVARKETDAAARKALMLASIHLSRHEVQKGVAAAEHAMKLSREPSVLFSAGTLLAQLGQEKRVPGIAEELERQLGSQPRMYAELLRGSVELSRRRPADAIERFKSGAQRHDSWLVRYALGRAYLEAGAYTEAQDELEKCQKRRGEATDVFVDTVPTYHIYPPVEYYLARAHEGMKSPAAAEAYRAFLALKKSDEDPMVGDARRRLAAIEAARPTPQQ